MGKGDDRRPAQISEAELAENWARTFDSGDRPDKAPRKRCPDAWKDRSVSSY